MALRAVGGRGRAANVVAREAAGRKRAAKVEGLQPSRRALRLRGRRRGRVLKGIATAGGRTAAPAGAEGGRASGRGEGARWGRHRRELAAAGLDVTRRGELRRHRRRSGGALLRRRATSGATLRGRGALAREEPRGAGARPSVGVVIGVSVRHCGNGDGGARAAARHQRSIGGGDARARGRGRVRDGGGGAAAGDVRRDRKERAALRRCGGGGGGAAVAGGVEVASLTAGRDASAVRADAGGGRGVGEDGAAEAGALSARRGAQRGAAAAECARHHPARPAGRTDGGGGARRVRVAGRGAAANVPIIRRARGGGGAEGLRGEAEGGAGRGDGDDAAVADGRARRACVAALAADRLGVLDHNLEHLYGDICLHRSVHDEDAVAVPAGCRVRSGGAADAEGAAAAIGARALRGALGALRDGGNAAVGAGPARLRRLVRAAGAGGGIRVAVGGVVRAAGRLLRGVEGRLLLVLHVGDELRDVAVVVVAHRIKANVPPQKLSARGGELCLQCRRIVGKRLNFGQKVV